MDRFIMAASCLEKVHPTWSNIGMYDLQYVGLGSCGSCLSPKEGVVKSVICHIGGVDAGVVAVRCGTSRGDLRPLSSVSSLQCAAFTVLDGVSPMWCLCLSIDLIHDWSYPFQCVLVNFPCDPSMHFFSAGSVSIHVTQSMYLYLIIPFCPCVSIHIRGQLYIVHMGWVCTRSLYLKLLLYLFSKMLWVDVWSLTKCISAIFAFDLFVLK